MSEVKVVSKEVKHIEKGEEKIDKESLEKLKEIERIIDTYDKKAETSIIDDFKKKLKTKVDAEIFDILPMSDYDKEQMLFELYGFEKKSGKSCASQYESIKDELNAMVE